MSKIKRTIALLTAVLLFAFCLPMFASAEEDEVPAPDAGDDVIDLADGEDDADAETSGETPAEESPASSSETSNYYVKDELHSVRKVAAQTYTGDVIQPALDITYFVKDANGVTSEKKLVVQKDYVVTYDNNVDVTDKALIVITYQGDYQVLGEESFKFRIVARDISKTVTIKEISAQNYTGKAIEPALSVSLNGEALMEGSDYVVTYSNNVNIGTAYATVEFFKNYAGEKKVEFLIKKLAAKSAVIAPIPDQAYTGEAIEPELTITCDGEILVPDEDYDVSFKNNTNVGTAIVKVTYKGAYSGTKTVTFQIKKVKDGEPNSAKSSNYTLNITGISDVYYNGKAQEPDLKITNGATELVKNEDYTVTYKDNINVGKATVIITLKGSYEGVRKEYFNIRPFVVAQGTIAKIDKQPYAFGRPVTPDALVSVTIDGKSMNLEEGVDYTFEYTNNRKVGTAGIKAVFINNFTGSISGTFEIGPADISDACIAPIPDQKHTGSAITPRVKVYVGKHKLKKDRDYTVAYSNNTALGQATATVTFKGNYTGTASATFNITETGSRGIAQTGEIGAAVIGGIAAIAGVTFFIVKKKKKNGEDED
ncbi:MAG: hypothetical protein K6G90_07955 [Clostridia bacterium]|nr:hypothetical protein [Clostridia bacterium]